MRKNVLVAPMDWGLGHAARCIPVINALLQRNCKVTIGGSGQSLDLLKKEFPGFEYVSLEGYNPIYSASSSLVLKMAEQLIKFNRTIWREHQQVQRLVKEKHLDLIISDNRFGCWAHGVKNIFITHQVNIQMPDNLLWISGIVNFLNHNMIRKFSQCWVPDIQDENNLTGVLSSSKKINVQHIGAVSRFAKSTSTLQKKYEIAAILSGPEPQRSILEGKLLVQLAESKLNSILIRGVSGSHLKRDADNVTVIDLLDSCDLQKVVEQSALVLARSGYSTIMDLARMEKNAIFIPTPGQTEQEYLARRLHEKGIVFYMTQDKFNLRCALEKARDYSGFKDIYTSEANFNRAIDEILQ